MLIDKGLKWSWLCALMNGFSLLQNLGNYILNSIELGATLKGCDGLRLAESFWIKGLLGEENILFHNQTVVNFVKDLTIIIWKVEMKQT